MARTSDKPIVKSLTGISRPGRLSRLGAAAGTGTRGEQVAADAY